MALPTAAHFAEADLPCIHAGNRADEPGIADIRERDFSVGRDDEDRGGVLQADFRHVVQHTAVIQLAVLCRLSKKRKAGAVKQLREDIRQMRFILRNTGGIGKSGRLGFVIGRNVLFKLGIGTAQFIGEPLAAFERRSQPGKVE